MNQPSYINLFDYERQAQKILPEPVWAYIHGAAADGVTAQANVQAWQNISLVPRALRNLEGGNVQCSLLERTHPCPIIAAPMAYQRLAHGEGELAMAAAAAAQGIGFTLSTQTSTPMQDVAKTFLGEPTRGPLWFQLYLQHDLEFNRNLIQEAESAGYEALVLTIDAPINGSRDGERRAGFTLPSHVSPVHLRNLVKTPPRSTQENIFDLMWDHSADWEDIDWLIANTKLPVFLKGITHPHDAVLAQKHGVKGLIVSNHGGRVLDTVAPTALLLPKIVEAVGGRMPIIVDSGIRRGTDILKAIALGATAVMVGRPFIYALACNGAYGAAHAIKILKDEFEIAMILCGCKTLKDVNRDILLSYL